MKLVYVVTAHKNARQVRGLLNAIDAPMNSYVLHVDRRSEAGVHAAACGFAARHSQAAVMVPRRIGWGSWSLCKLHIDGIATALRMSDQWDYLINLSGQDYPLRTQEEIVQALAAGPAGANRIQVIDFADSSENARKRLNWYYASWRGEMRRVWPRRVPRSAKIYWGSQWGVFSRAACEYLTGPAAAKWRRFFRFSLIPDEMFFQTALMNSPLAGTIINNHMRHIVWAGGPNPKTFSDEDRLSLAASDAWFARKFDDTTQPVILEEMERALARRRAASTRSAA